MITSRGLVLASVLAAVYLVVPKTAQTANYFVSYTSPNTVVYVVESGSSCDYVPHTLTPSVAHVTDIAVSPTNELYICTNQNLYQVDTSTFTSTLIGQFSDPSARDMLGLDFGKNGALYGIDADGTIWRIATTGVQGVVETTDPVHTGVPASDLAWYGGDVFYSTGLVNNQAHLMQIDITTPNPPSDLGLIAQDEMFASLDFDGCELFAIEYPNNGSKYRIVSFCSHGAGNQVCNPPLDLVIGGASFAARCTSDPCNISVLDASWGRVKRAYR